MLCAHHTYIFRCLLCGPAPEEDDGSNLQWTMANRIYYTLLNVDQREEVEAYLHERAWLEPSESIRQLGRAGAGNMNLTLRVDTGRVQAP